MEAWGKCVQVSQPQHISGLSLQKGIAYPTLLGYKIKDSRRDARNSSIYNQDIRAFVYSVSSDPGLFNDIEEVILTYRNEKISIDLFKKERAIYYQNICPYNIARYLCHICGNCFNVSPLGWCVLSWGSCCNLTVRQKWTGAAEKQRKWEQTPPGV